MVHLPVSKREIHTSICGIPCFTDAATGMFPIDFNIHDYDAVMVKKFDDLLEPYGYTWKMTDIFPKVLVAGENAGALTEEGAAFLDETGTLRASIPLCPPEGDAGTGMTATNLVAPGTGNVSAGIFAHGRKAGGLS